MEMTRRKESTTLSLFLILLFLRLCNIDGPIFCSTYVFFLLTVDDKEAVSTDKYITDSKIDDC